MTPYIVQYRLNLLGYYCEQSSYVKNIIRALLILALVLLVVLILTEIVIQLKTSHLTQLEQQNEKLLHQLNVLNKQIAVLENNTRQSNIAVLEQVTVEPVIVKTQVMQELFSLFNNTKRTLKSYHWNEKANSFMSLSLSVEVTDDKAGQLLTDITKMSAFNSMTTMRLVTKQNTNFIILDVEFSINSTKLSEYRENNE